MTQAFSLPVFHCLERREGVFGEELANRAEDDKEGPDPMRILTGLSALVLLSACATQADRDLPDVEAPPPPMVSGERVDAARLNAAITSPERPDTDVERDELRQPAAVMEFMALQPGDTVLELEAGGGYFTEILSRYLTAETTLYMQNPAAFDGFLGDAAEMRMSNMSAPTSTIFRSPMRASTRPPGFRARTNSGTRRRTGNRWCRTPMTPFRKSTAS